jgi:hypothetical protein
MSSPPKVIRSSLPEGIEEYSGRWVALRHGKVVADAGSLRALMKTTGPAPTMPPSGFPIAVPGSSKPSVPIVYPAGYSPTITLAITPLRDAHAPGPTIYVDMVVDSGANVSLLGKQYLRELGIRQRGAKARSNAIQCQASA